MSDRSRFVPWQPRQLVLAGPGVEMQGPGSCFRVGELVDGTSSPGALLQLADRRR